MQLTDGIHPMVVSIISTLIPQHQNGSGQGHKLNELGNIFFADKERI